MRIAVDARMMGAGNTRGIGRYIKETTDALRILGGGHEFVLLQPDIPWYSMAEQWRMLRVFREAKADLVWVPHWNVPLLYRGPLAITIHDLLLLHQPMSAKSTTRGPVLSWLKRVAFRLVLAHAVRRASVILVPTKFVADDVAFFFPRAKSKIVVTGEGISRLPNSVGTIHELSLPTKTSNHSFLFYFGSAYPHKGLSLLLEVWTKLSAAHPKLSLVIAGEKDVFMKRVETEVERLNLPRVHFPGRLSDAELAEHLSEAAAHVHPTSFEGFGLPPLEALSLGCPTVVSDIPVLRETLPDDPEDSVGAGGVFFFKSGDADAMINAIEAVLRDPDSAHAAARKGGAEAARRHDWNAVARRTLAALTHAPRS